MLPRRRWRRGLGDLTVDGHGGVPASGVSAVVLNVTVTQPQPRRLHHRLSRRRHPAAGANLNFVAGETMPNLVVAPVGADGKVDLYNGSGGTVQLIADVSGWFACGGPPPTGAFTSLTPTRLLDTRNGTGAPEARWRRGIGALDVAATAGFPLPGSRRWC